MSSLRSRLDAATSHLPAPLAVVDLDVLEANADDLVRRAGGTLVRLASKSVRVRALLDHVLARPGWAGIMAFSLAEALWLVEEGHGDVLLGYPVVDRTALATLFGGGYIASGPPGHAREPRLTLPAGLRLTGAEGAGEVQTPVRLPRGTDLAVGDRVWLRHAKAGELMERLGVVHLVRGERIERSVPTYRGDGRTFG